MPHPKDSTDHGVMRLIRGAGRYLTCIPSNTTKEARISAGRKARTRVTSEKEELRELLDYIWSVREEETYAAVVELTESYSNARLDLPTFAQKLFGITHSDEAVFEKLRNKLPAGYDIEVHSTPFKLRYLRITIPPDTITHRVAFGLTISSAHNYAHTNTDSQIEVLLSAALGLPNLEVALITLDAGDAQRALDLMQDNLDRYWLKRRSLIKSDQTRRRMRRQMNKLSCNSGLFPTSFMVPNLSCHYSACLDYGTIHDLYSGTHNGYKVAVKTVRIERQSDHHQVQLDFWHEVLMWRQLHHPNIVSIEGIERASFPPTSMGGLVLPWMKNGNILKYMNTLLPEPSPTQLHKWMVEIADGLQYLHSENIVHGNLRGKNVLVDDGGHARITDFGLLGDERFGNLRDINIRDWYWLAPEVIKHGVTAIVSFPNDIFAFAYLCVEIYSRKQPFTGVDPVERYTLVLNGGRPERPVTPSGAQMTDSLWSLVTQCWHNSPKQRPNAPSLLQMLQQMKD